MSDCKGDQVSGSSNCPPRPEVISHRECKTQALTSPARLVQRRVGLGRKPPKVISRPARLVQRWMEVGRRPPLEPKSPLFEALTSPPLSPARLVRRSVYRGILEGHKDAHDCVECKDAPDYSERLEEPIHPFFRCGILPGDEDEGALKVEAPRKMEVKKPIFIVLGDEVWETEEAEEPKSKAHPRQPTGTQWGIDVWGNAMLEHEKPELEVMEPDDMPHWMTVRQYRHHWNKRWSDHYGLFEDTTRIPPMRFTDKAVKAVDVERDTLQIFSVKLAATRGSLQLPLDVFGMVSMRDPVDHNRNIIFQRERDECQTLTEKDPYLVLAGPTRAVMFSDSKSNPVIMEVDLKVKGTTESEDRYLSFLVSPLTCCSGTMFSRVFNCAYTSKLSRLEFTLGHIVFSVEATIFVSVIDGSWPDGLRGLFTALTTGYSDRSSPEYGSGVGHQGIILLDSGCENLPVTGEGKIKLSRHVISAEHGGEVIFEVKAFEGDNKVVEKKISFDPLKANKSISELDVGFCRMEITVFWSLISYNP